MSASFTLSPEGGGRNAKPPPEQPREMTLVVKSSVDGNCRKALLGFRQKPRSAIQSKPANVVSNCAVIVAPEHLR